jgi:hypothetical protein
VLACSRYSYSDYMVVSYRDAAEALWGEAGAHAHDAYDRIRQELYPELPGQLPIVIGLTAYGRCDGLTRTGWRHGPRITLASDAFGRGASWVDDILTHEMLHAWLVLAGLQPGHDTASWYEHVRRLSPSVIGCEVDAGRGADRKSVRIPNPCWEPGSSVPKTVVRKQRVDGAVQHADMAQWPRAFRPDGYYQRDRPIECPSY